VQSVTCVYSHTNPYLYLTNGIRTQHYNKPRVVISDSICGDTQLSAWKIYNVVQ